ncbi:MAG: GNAT family N-acetyltransferase [Defluviitaleaceae bacterium]|nr:GNAT family N-acetyltransferase [Defluviitaleaceae bacterium]
MIVYKWISGKQDDALIDAYMIRRVVFIEEQAVPVEEEIIPWEEEISEHLTIYDKDKPVAVGRILLHNDKFILGRIAVLKEHRGKGFGRLVTQALIDKSVEMGAMEVELSSQTHAIGLYEKLGFVAYGDEYMDAGIPHYSMKRKV